MKIKILEDCSSSGDHFKKDELIDLPTDPSPRKQKLLALVSMGFATTVKEDKPKPADAK